MSRLDLPSIHPSGSNIKPLGIIAAGKQIVLYFQSETSDGMSSLTGYVTSDGENYALLEKHIELLVDGKDEVLDRCSSFRFSQMDQKMLMTYVRTMRRKSQLCVAESDDLLHWKSSNPAGDIQTEGMIVPNFQFEGQYVLYFGEKTLSLAYSKDLKKWHIADGIVTTPGEDLDSSVLGTLVIEEGILLLTYSRVAMENSFIYSMHAMLMDKYNPQKLLWRLPSFWTEPIDWVEDYAEPLGIAYIDHEVVSFWNLGKRGVFRISHPLFANTNKTDD